MHKAFPVMIALCVSTLVYAQTVVQRVRTGHTVEDIDVKGKQMLVSDGYEIFAADKSGFTKVVDARDCGATSHVNAFTWIDSENLFALIEPTHRERMVLCDEKGGPKGFRPITYAGGFFPAHTEGITYLPKGTPFAGHLALVAFEPFDIPRIEIMTTAGTVIHEIFLGAPFDEFFIGSVDAFGPDHLVVATVPNHVYVIDYDGTVVSGPVIVYEAANVESIVRTPAGVAVADYYSGRIFALDSALQRMPEDDLHNAFGVRVRPDGLAWNSESSRFIATTQNGDFSATRSGFSLPVSLDDASVALFPAAHGIPRQFRHPFFMADEAKTGLVNRLTPSLLLYDRNGKLVEQIDVSALGGPLSFAVYYAPNEEFILRFAEANRRLRVVDRSGAFVRDIDLNYLGPVFLGVMTLDGADLLIQTGLGLLRLDQNGALLDTYSLAPLRMPQLAGITAITSGPHAGKFAACDSSNAEVAVFTLP